MKVKDRPSYARLGSFSAGYGGRAQYEDAEGGKVGGDGARVVMRRVWFLRMRRRPPRWGAYEGAVKPNLDPGNRLLHLMINLMKARRYGELRRGILTRRSEVLISR
jgi:hypothetical protein